MQTQSQLKELLRAIGYRPDKRLGQHFMTDPNMLEYIVREGAVEGEDAVLEIGAGTGLLTAHLAEKARVVWAVEIHRTLCQVLDDHVGSLPSVNILEADALQSKHALNAELLDAVARDLEEHPRSSLRVIANLPYNISTLVIPCLLESQLPVRLFVVTVQKEVADRLAARPSTKDYGNLSVIVQAHATVEMLRVLPRDVFWPKPNVLSAVVRVVPRTDALARIRDYPTFVAVSRAIFQLRRKTLLNALTRAAALNLPRESAYALQERTQIDLARRGEALSVDEIIQLANALQELGA